MQMSLSLAMAVLAAPPPAPPPPPAPVAMPLPDLVIRDSGDMRIFDAHLRYDGDVLKLNGRVCRRTNWSGMQPAVLDIDRIAADASRAEHADAYLPRLSLRVDQSCGSWQTRFKGPIAPGDRILVCVPRPHSHCRI